MSVPVRMTLGEFLALRGMLWGEIHVSERVPGRKGARRGNRHKGTESRTSLAGPGDGDGPTDGGSATSSVARSSDRAKYAGSADGQGEEPKRALIPGKEQWVPSFEKPERELQAVTEIPADSWEFTREVHAGVSTVAVMQGFLGSQDEKIRLRAFEMWMDLAYGKYSRKRGEERATEKDWGIPRPERD